MQVESFIDAYGLPRKGELLCEDIIAKQER